MKNIFKEILVKQELRLKEKRLISKSKELDALIGGGLAFIMTKCKILLDEGAPFDLELKEMVKVVGSTISEKEELDRKIEEAKEKLIKLGAQ